MGKTYAPINLERNEWQVIYKFWLLENGKTSQFTDNQSVYPTGVSAPVAPKIET